MGKIEQQGSAQELCGERKRSFCCISLDPQPAARRGEAWRGVAGGEGVARVDVPLVLMLIQVGKEPPL